MPNVFKRASAIYKKNPNKKWSSCVKEAGREVKAGKKVGYAPYTRKKIREVSAVAKKIRAARPDFTRKQAVNDVSIGSIPSGLRRIAGAIAGKIGSLEAKKFSEKRKLLKRKIQKEINELKKQYRKVS